MSNLADCCQKWSCKSCRRAFVVAHATPQFCIYCGSRLSEKEDPTSVGRIAVGETAEVRVRGGWFSCRVLSCREAGGSFLVELDQDDSVSSRLLLVQDAVSDLRVVLEAAAPLSPTARSVLPVAAVAVVPPPKPVPPTTLPKLPPQPNTPPKKIRPPAPTPPVAAAVVAPSSPPSSSSPSPPPPPSSSSSSSSSTSNNPNSLPPVPTPPSPNQRRKTLLHNSVNPMASSLLLTKQVALFPTDPNCAFDWDALDSDNINPDVRSVRIGFFGECNIGKSCLVRALLQQPYDATYAPTVFETHKTTVDLNAAKKQIPIELWDVSGNDRYARKRMVIYPNVSAFVVCFDLNDHYTFTNACKVWLPEVAACCQGLPVVLVGTKSDEGTAKVSQAEIDLAMKNSPVQRCARPFLYVETSAKNRKFVDDLYCKVVYSVLFDVKRVSERGGPGLQAGAQLAKLEEIRKSQQQLVPTSPSKPSAPVALPPKPHIASSGSTPSSPSLQRASSGTFVTSSSSSSSSPALSRASPLSSSPVAPMSEWERQMQHVSVSAPTGFRHLKSAAEILKEFDPDFASRQKRPAAIPIAEALTMVRNNTLTADPNSAPSGDVILSPKSATAAAAAAAAKKKVLWTQSQPKYDPVDGAVFAKAHRAVEPQREGDIQLKVGDIVCMNAAQDFSEQWWFGAVGDADPGYFPQDAVNWIENA